MSEVWVLERGPAEILVLGGLALLSLADLRYRTLPGIGIFFAASMFFGLGGNPWRVFAVVLVVVWGKVEQAPLLLVGPAVLLPAAWPVLLTAVGVRRRLIASGDLLALAGIAFLTDWEGPLLALLGVMGWRSLWKNRGLGAAPALPGMWLGIAAATFFARLP